MNLPAENQMEIISYDDAEIIDSSANADTKKGTLFAL